MVICCWSAKGGVGTTVVAAALALVASKRSERSVLLVDLVGDLPSVLGIPEPEGPGIGDWLSAGEDVPADGLARLEVAAVRGVSLLTRGTRPLAGNERAEVLCAVFDAEPRDVIVDCGCLWRSGDGDADVRRSIAARATHSLLVTRPCYVALRHAVAAPLTPSAVVLVEEPGRSLDAWAVEEVIGSPVACRVPYDPAIARAVDAGLLSQRVPRQLERALRGAA
ncbi:MAG: hypothetical protein N2037_11235 [Acidimicrobiales bacterium]|nr:hypothetical protein [Acidimicrobiales bacterium]